MSKKSVLNDAMPARRMSSYGNPITASTGEWYEKGVLHTRFGFATLYRQGGRRLSAHADFIWKGRWYRRSWDRMLTQRGLAMLAYRFVNDVVTGKFKKS